MSGFDLFMQLFENITEFIMTPPVLYLFFCVILLWVVSLFFMIIRR